MNKYSRSQSTTELAAMIETRQASRLHSFAKQVNDGCRKQFRYVRRCPGD